MFKYLMLVILSFKTAYNTNTLPQHVNYMRQNGNAWNIVVNVLDILKLQFIFNKTINSLDHTALNERKISNYWTKALIVAWF